MFWKFEGWEGGKWLDFGKEEFVWETKGRGKLYRLTIKWASSKTVVKDFPHTLRVLSTDRFKSIASHKNCIFLKNKLFFGSLFSLMRHNFSVLFHLKLYRFEQNDPIKVQNFRLSAAQVKLNQVSTLIGCFC